MNIFKYKYFNELSVSELYEIVRARTEIFLLEQKIICQDFDGEDYKLTRGSSITVKVNSGLDGTYIQGKSLGVYVIECDKSGKILENANKIWLIKPEMELVIGEDGVTSTKNIEITEDELALRKAALETQIGVEKSKSYTFKSIELKASKTGMMLGKNYLIFVEGFDSNKTKVSNFTKDYGFYFAPKDAAPSLTLEQPSENTTYLAKGKSLKVKGSSTTEMGSPIIEIRVRDKNDEKVIKTLEKELVVKENDDLSNTSTFEYEISSSLRFNISVAVSGLSPRPAIITGIFTFSETVMKLMNS